MRKKWLSFIIVILLLIGSLFYALTTGSIKITPWELISGLIKGDNPDVQVIYDLRFPRIIIALFAGAALSVSGVLFQAVMRNPLAEPGIIGISSGSAFMSVVMVSFFPALFFYMPLFAFLGGALAFLLVYFFSWRSGLDPLRMILIGVAINAVFTSMSQVFGFFRSSSLTNATQLTTSSLSMKNWADVEIMVIYGTIGLILAFAVFAWCNFLGLEDKTAKSLGLNVNLARFVIAAIAVLLASIATTIAGMFSFVGLIVPHIARSIVGTDHKVLIPFTALTGGLLIVLADTVGRTILAPMEIPASMIMALVGGVFLIFLLRRSDRVYGN